MAERQSMTTPEVVAKTMIDEHADFLREAVDGSTGVGPPREFPVP